MEVTKAITRKPGKNFHQGITQSLLGTPDFELALRQHKAYCIALEKAGVEVIQLPADESFPDGCFVEDTAVVTDAGAMITRPGDPSRRGEVENITDELSKWKTISMIEAPGTLDGGDVMKVGHHYYIGLSARTNLVGAQQLASWLNTQGYSSSFVEVKTVLHLKTGITCPTEDLAIGLAPYLDQINVAHKIELNPVQAYAANCMQVNGHLFLPSGFPEIRAKLAEALPESHFIELELSEFEKMDGGLTCLSLLF